MNIENHVVEEAWSHVRDYVARAEIKEEIPSPFWTQARVHMLAVKEREEKRAEAQAVRIREREEGLRALRKEAEESLRMREVLQVESNSRREEELKLEESKRAEARRREREQRDAIRPTVKFEEDEAWDTF